MQEALRIAFTLQQTELQERRNETFYVDEVQHAARLTELHAKRAAMAT